MAATGVVAMLVISQEEPGSAGACVGSHGRVPGRTCASSTVAAKNTSCPLSTMLLYKLVRPARSSERTRTYTAGLRVQANDHATAAAQCRGSGVLSLFAHTKRPQTSAAVPDRHWHWCSTPGSVHAGHRRCLAGHGAAQQSRRARALLVLHLHQAGGRHHIARVTPASVDDGATANRKICARVLFGAFGPKRRIWRRKSGDTATAGRF